MSRPYFKPNSKKHKMFMQFAKGKRPSELVASGKVSEKDYRISMVYYELFKKCMQHKKKLLGELIEGWNANLRQIKSDEKMMATKSVYEGILKKLKALPMEFWQDEERARNMMEFYRA